MTNDTNYRGKANAVFFAAVMVISMVAVGFAAAPAAAQASGTSGGDVSPDSAETGVEQSYDIELNLSDVNTSDGSSAANVTFNFASEFDLSSASLTNEAVTPNTTSVGSNLNASANTVTIDWSDSGGVNSETLTVSFTIDQVSTTADGNHDITADVDANADGTYELTGEPVGTVSSSTTAGMVDGDANLSSGGSYWAGQELGLVIPQGVSSSTEFQLRSYDSGDDEIGTVEDGFVVGNDRNATVDTDGLEGDFILVNANNNNQAIQFTNSDGVATGTTTTTGDYDAASFEVSTQSLTTEFADDSVDNAGDVTTDLEVDSNRGTYDIVVSSDDFAYDDEDLGQIFNESFSNTVVDDDDEEFRLENVNDGDFALNFSEIDSGDYEFDFDVADTDAADSASITVNDVGDGELDIDPSSITDQQGDVVPITVTASEAATSGELVIGNEEDVGYQANVTITDFGDDDEVTVYFNTYAAGNATEFGADNVVYLDEDDLDEDANIEFEAANETDIDNQLDTGDYELAVSTQSDNPSSTLDSPDNVGTLFIEERSTGENVNTWAVSDSVAGDIVDADDPVEALNERVGENVTQSDSIANGDQVVHQIEASGLTGILEATGADGDTSQFTQALNDSDGEGISLRLRETRESAGPNEDLRTVNVSSTSGINVVVDDDSDVLYVIVDTNTIQFNDGAIESGEEVGLDARLRVEDERLLNFNRVEQSDDDVDGVSDIYESATGTYNIVEPDASFDQDPYNVTNAEGQLVSGSSNLAAENEVTLRVRSSSDTRPAFSKSDTVDVAADGSFETEFDFSEQAVGDEYTITARNNLFENPEVDGTVLESVEQSANFAVSDLSPQEATATAGDSVDVSATIENTGNAEGTQTVALTLDGDELDTQEVTLADGDSQTVEFTADTSGLDAGDYEHGIATDDDEATGTLTIEAASGDDGGDDSSGDDSSGDDSSGDDSSGDDSSGDDSSGDGSTDDGTPGFGALVALVALIAAALLATRRNE